MELCWKGRAEPSLVTWQSWENIKYSRFAGSGWMSVNQNPIVAEENLTYLFLNPELTTII